MRLRLCIRVEPPCGFFLLRLEMQPLRRILQVINDGLKIRRVEGWDIAMVL